MGPDPRFADLALGRFADDLSADSPVPGGGSSSAVVGALAAALLGMVCRLTRGRERYADFEATAAEVESQADRLRAELLDLADADAAAYGGYLAARRLPRDSDGERAHRAAELERAAAQSVAVPLRIAGAAALVAELAVRLAGASNPHAISDVGCAGAFAGAAVRGAVLNARINLPALPEIHPLRTDAALEIDRLLSAAATHERAVAELVETVLA